MSAVTLFRFQKTGSAAAAEMARASIAGPQVQGRVWGPITTANTNAMTRKTEESETIREEEAEMLKC